MVGYRDARIRGKVKIEYFVGLIHAQLGKFLKQVKATELTIQSDLPEYLKEIIQMLACTEVWSNCKCHDLVPVCVNSMIDLPTHNRRNHEQLHANSLWGN